MSRAIWFFRIKPNYRCVSLLYAIGYCLAQRRLVTEARFFDPRLLCPLGFVRGEMSLTILLKFFASRSFSMYRNTSMPINARKRSSTGSFFTTLRRGVARRLTLRGLTVRLRFAGRVLRFRDTYST